MPRGVIMPWLCPQEPRVARLRISEIYVQTPGPLAGMLAGRRRMTWRLSDLAPCFEG
ncbi:hypothetical protein ACFSHQ_23580 [Gemmobacter lanyuensis]